MEGYYETIQKCFIENQPAIPKHNMVVTRTFLDGRSDR
jgi:hypothetical protein